MKVAAPTDVALLAKHNKKMAKANRTILDLVKDCLIPHIAEKNTVKETYDALITLYQSMNISHKILLKNKLTVTCMSNTDAMATFLMKTIDLR
jgi:hypothetical protein